MTPHNDDSPEPIMTGYSRTTPVWRWPAYAAFVLLSASTGTAQAVSSFQVKVPHRTGGGQLELSAIKIVIQLNSSANIGFSVSEAASGALNTQTMDLATATDDCFASGQCFADLPNLPGGG